MRFRSSCDRSDMILSNFPFNNTISYLHIQNNQDAKAGDPLLGAREEEIKFLLCGNPLIA